MIPSPLPEGLIITAIMVALLIVQHLTRKDILLAAFTIGMAFVFLLEVHTATTLSVPLYVLLITAMIISFSTIIIGYKYTLQAVARRLMEERRRSEWDWRSE